MKKDDDEKRGGQRKSALAEMMPVIRLICGAKEREEAKNRQEIQILDSLEYPGGKRMH